MASHFFLQVRNDAKWRPASVVFPLAFEFFIGCENRNNACVHRCFERVQMRNPPSAGYADIASNVYPTRPHRQFERDFLSLTHRQGHTHHYILPICNLYTTIYVFLVHIFNPGKFQCIANCVKYPYTNP